MFKTTLLLILMQLQLAVAYAQEFGLSPQETLDKINSEDLYINPDMATIDGMTIVFAEHPTYHFIVFFYYNEFEELTAVQFHGKKIEIEALALSTNVDLTFERTRREERNGVLYVLDYVPNSEKSYRMLIFDINLSTDYVRDWFEYLKITI